MPNRSPEGRAVQQFLPLTGEMGASQMPTSSAHLPLGMAAPKSRVGSINSSGLSCRVGDRDVPVPRCFDQEKASRQ